MRAALAAELVQRRQLDDRPDEPDGQGGQHRPAQRHAVSHDERRKRGTHIDEPRSESEQSGEDEADGIRDLEPRVLVREQHSCGPERVQAEEPARRQEGERDQLDARVAAAVRRGAGGDGEHEDADADRQEQR